MTVVRKGKDKSCIMEQAKVNIPDDLIEIHDPEIDPGQIMDQIRERIRRRREELGYERRTFPTFGATAYPGEPADMPYDPDLYHHLRLVNETFAPIDTRPVLASSPSTRVPILGRLWQRIRGEAHNLVLFYVNRAVAHQTDVNRHLISVINRLTALSQEQQRAMAALRKEVESLKERPT